jgi:two-component system chemotaxis sensor kinase CheA
VVGPLDEPALADQLAELFNEIPGLGRSNGRRPARRTLRTSAASSGPPTSTDDDLLDLFTFHVSRELGRDPGRRAQRRPSRPSVLDRHRADDDGFGFFVDVGRTWPPSRW